MSSGNETHFDVIVIGGGAVGENVAQRTVDGGLSTVVIESELVGGECSYWACMPSKALLRPAAALEAARRVMGANEAITGTLDAEKVLERRNSFTSSWDDAGQVEWLDGVGISLLRGRGRLAGERIVEVTKPDGSIARVVANQAVVLANGSVPIVPPIQGLDSVSYWGTREATSAKYVPGRLVVLGGGVSGVELAQAFARFGSSVTIIARHGLLGNFPEPASELVVDALRGEGLDLRLHTGTARVSQAHSGAKQVHLDNGDVVEGDELLVSTGRRPALEDLGLEVVGVNTEKLSVGPDGWVGEVPEGWLYAVGDVAGKVLLTHQGKYEARITGDVIAARARGEVGPDVAPWSRFAVTADTYAVPQVVFTDPEIAMVGRSAAQAEGDGVRVRVVEHELNVAGASLLADEYRGWAQMVVDEDRGVIVGMTFAGQDVAELLHSATIAIAGEVPLTRLWHAVPPYPTMSEVWLRLLESYGL